MKTTIALLLVSGLIAHPAAADERLKKPTKKGEKINAYLESMGINNPEILAFTSAVSERVEGRYLRVTEEQFDTGRLVLHYRMQPKVSIRQLELKFQPEGYESELVATNHSFMVHYTYRF